MAINYKQFETQSGFKSPGFTVDTAGNVVVRTLTQTFIPEAATTPPDYSINEDGGAFSITNLSGANPTITLTRGESKTFGLNLTSLGFNFFTPSDANSSVPGTAIINGISHANAVTGNTLASEEWTFAQTWVQEASFDRKVKVTVPDVTSVTKLNGKKIPVVIALHDVSATSTSVTDDVNFITDKILIAPQGYRNTWNVGYSVSQADDLALIDSILTKLETYDNVDVRDITFVGYGVGGQLAQQYFIQTTRTNLKNLVLISSLMHFDQHKVTYDSQNNRVDKFYSLTLNPLAELDSTQMVWTETTPLSGRKILMFNGTNNLNWPFEGGLANGLDLKSAPDTIYAWAKAENDVADQLSSGAQQPNGEVLYNYKNGLVRLFSYEGVGSNFGDFLTGVQTYILDQIDVTAYEVVPVPTTLTGAAANNQQSGTFTFTVPVDTPDTIYYGDADGEPFGTVTVEDPTFTGIGSFSAILNTGDLISNGQDAEISLQPTGSYGTVSINPAGGGFISNMDINANSIQSTGQTTLTPSNADVVISPQGTGVLTVQPINLGTIDNIDIGQTTPQKGSFSLLETTQGTLNNTTIGATVPATAAFTSATVTTAPTDANDVSNKNYVDSTSTVLAIALGV